MKNAIAAAAIIIAFVAGGIAGLYASSVYGKELPFVKQQPAPASTEGLIPVNVSMAGNTVMLQSGCRLLTFDVTDDQAFSISRGLEDFIGARPLTHDIMKDILENFNISLTLAKIDSFEDGVYKARMVFSGPAGILEIDARPSDTIALAGRAAAPLYMDKAIFENRSANVC